MSDQKSTRRGGFYWEGNKPYISVTQVLKVIDKPAIRYWYGNEIYLAMVKDPTLSEKEAMASPYVTSKKAMRRGTRVHDFIENYKNGAKMPEEFVGNNELIGYYNAFLFFLKDHPQFEVISSERTVKNEKEGYKGTLDLHAKVGEREMLIDVKTNKEANVYDEVALQLSAYNEPLSGGKLPMFALALGAEGQYTFKEQLNCYDEFLYAKGLWTWKNKKKCIKVGYLEE